MPAGKPMGKVPEKFGRNEEADTDVNFDSVDSSDTEQEAKPSGDLDFDESDLNSVQEQQKVPYKRFREVNETAKSLRSEIDKLTARLSDEAAEKIRLQAELARKGSSSNDYETDLDVDDFSGQDQKLLEKIAYLENTVSNLSTKYEKQTLKGSIDRLAAEYPDANRISVLGIATSQGVNSEEGLRELFEMQQNAINEAVEKKIRGILESKKAAQQRNVRPVRRNSFALKEEDRPKSFRAARELAKKLYGD